MFQLICLFLALSTSVSSRESSLSALLSRLDKGSNVKPLILVLDEKTLLPLTEKHSYHSYRGDADGGLAGVIQQLAESNNAYPRPHSSLYHHRNRDYSNSYQNRLSDYHYRSKSRSHSRGEHHIDTSHSNDLGYYGKVLSRTKKDEDMKPNVAEKAALRSPIIKSLLTLRNSLRCGARNECQDTCSQNYDGAKEQACNNKCEVQYQCEEPQDSCDECDASDDDGCAQSNQCTGSTKGYMLEPEPPGCKRC